MTPTPPSLDDLAAFNHELLALAQARAPLADALTRGAQQMAPGGAGLAERVGQRLERGETLDGALGAEGAGLPTAYAALVRAGARAGRLPAALEGFARVAERGVALRRTALLALTYPLTLAAAAWALVVLSAAWLLPTYDWVEPRSPFWLSAFRLDAGLAWWVAFTPPVLVALVLVAAWQRGAAGRGALAPDGGALGWAPGVRGACRLSAAALFAELLALMVEHGEPLPEALELSARAVGSPRLTAGAESAARRLRSGATLGAESPGLPPLVRLGLSLAGRGPRLAAALRGAAHEYRLRADAATHRVVTLLPAVATALFGGGAVGAYALLMLQPYIRTLYETANWHGG